jgi:cellobiose-specific phosphotransferase system component IIA
MSSYYGDAKKVILKAVKYTKKGKEMENSLTLREAQNLFEMAEGRNPNDPKNIADLQRSHVGKGSAKEKINEAHDSTASIKYRQNIALRKSFYESYKDLVPILKDIQTKVNKIVEETK